MNFLRTLTLYVLLLASLATPSVAAAGASGPQADRQTVRALLEAVMTDDYSGFIGHGTPQFRELTRQQFDQVVTHVGPRLRQGYQLEYFGQLRQQNLDISVWKVTFSDNRDDLLATLNIRDGRVGGFYLR